VEGVRSQLLLSLLLLTSTALAGVQLIGTCPPIPPRSPKDVKELRGVVIDENLAVVPKGKVLLQIQAGDKFRDVAAVETDSTGRYRFASQRQGNYRLVFSGFKGLCRAEIPIRYTNKGLRGMRLTLPAAASDTCPQYCERGLKIAEMSGTEGRQ